ncbi:radical SAM protein [Ectothiorhodospiraceae bacterium BW-2]|nr:radical SAM protein [Ectothiorhodospiraceae bacterium BW-2]
MTDKTPASTYAYELHGSCYLNITSECTLRCRFCPKYHHTWQVQQYDLALKQEPELAQVLQAVGDASRYREIVFCGLGEPTQRLSLLLQVATELKLRYGSTIRVNTDGLANLLYHRDVTAQMAAVVDAVSISLNGQNSTVYERHTRPKREGTYPAMLDFARAAKAAGMAVTLTAIDGLEGLDIEACRKIAEEEIGVSFRRRVLDEVG